MSPGPADPVVLAQQICAYELRDAAESAVLLEGAHRIQRRLADRLVPLLGHNGFESLWGRAVERALRPGRGQTGTGRPMLADTRGETLFSLPLGHSDPAALILAVLSHLLQLLWKFLGGDLSMRLLVQSWPPDAFEPDRQSREDGR